MLKSQWYNLCSWVSAESESRDIVWNYLESKYSEPHRFYHTLEHIRHCLQEFSHVPSQLQLAEIELAIWFHDVVYDTRASDNEEKSLDFALRCLRLMGLPNGYSYYLSDMIMASKHSDQIPIWSDYGCFLDIDLAILGQNQEIFSQYNINIRKEYDWVPDHIYNEKRKEILQNFLNRPKIYRTEYFLDSYENSARCNLQEAVSKL